MIAELGRYLHQPISDVLDWDGDVFFQMHAQIDVLLDAERPRKD